MTDLIRRYEAVTNTQLLQVQETHCTDHQQQMIAEIGRLRREYEQLQARLMAYTGEDLSSLTSVDELDELEQQLEAALCKVRARKDELLTSLNDKLQLKVTVTAVGVETEEIAEPLPPPSPPFAYLLNVNEKSAASTVLQLWPQADDDDVGSGGGSGPPRGLQLWKQKVKTKKDASVRSYLILLLLLTKLR